MTFNGFVRDPANPAVFYAGPLADSEGGFFIPVEAESTPVAFSWNGIEFSSASPFKPRRVSGWDGAPDGDAPEESIPGRHGSRRSRVTRRRRTVEIEGSCTSRSARDYLFRLLGDALSEGFGDGDETSPLVGSVAGRELTAEAQLLRFQPTIETLPWGKGVWTWALQFICPDPIRYGAQQTQFAGVFAPTVGLVYPVTYPVTYPAAPPSGQVSLVNSGNAAADAVFTLVGPLLNSPGVTVLETGEKVWFGFDLADGDVMTVDTAEGACLLNGEFRSPAVGASLLADVRLPPGPSTVQVLGDAGGSGSPGGYVSFRPAFW